MSILWIVTGLMLLVAGAITWFVPPLTFLQLLLITLSAIRVSEQEV